MERFYILTVVLGDAGVIPGSLRYPEEGNSNPLQYSCLGNPMDRGASCSEAPWEATWGHWHKSREPRVSWSNPRKTWRVLFQRLLMPDSPTMTPEQGRAPLATSRKTDFPSTTQEAPWVPHRTSWENPHWRRSSRKTTRCPRQGEMGAFFSCLTWRAIPGPLSKLHRSIDSL